jgi:hypothetical protein
MACRSSLSLTAAINGAISGVRTHIAVSRHKRTSTRQPQADALTVRSGWLADRHTASLGREAELTVAWKLILFPVYAALACNASEPNWPRAASMNEAAYCAALGSIAYGELIVRVGELRAVKIDSKASKADRLAAKRELRAMQRCLKRWSSER